MPARSGTTTVTLTDTTLCVAAVGEATQKFAVPLPPFLWPGHITTQRQQCEEDTSRWQQATLSMKHESLEGQENKPREAHKDKCP